MMFVVIKSHFDGICGGHDRIPIERVFDEVRYPKGWESLKQLHDSILRWSKEAIPGSVFCTAVSAIVAVHCDQGDRKDDTCPHCYDEGLEYGDIDGVEARLEQRVKCPHCGKAWTDLFYLGDRKELKT